MNTDDRTGTQGSNAGESAPRFSRDFMREVQRCETVDEFREVLSRRSLWINRNAAESVFRYFKAQLSESIPDEELENVTGGTMMTPEDRESLETLLQKLAQQLQERGDPGSAWRGNLV